MTMHPPVPLPNEASPGLYVHIPFCRYICPYCDFNVYARQEDLIPQYVDALIAEMQLRRQEHSDVTSVSTLFIGGGTPSLMPASEIGRIIEAASSLLGLESGAEVTMEANPEGISEAYVRELIASGVNRLSLGVQTLQPAGLKVLGRLHGAVQAETAFKDARRAGMENISLDFIFGWPGQTPEDWDRDLDTILDWGPDHLSLYSLIVEPGTPMATAVHRGQLMPMDDDDVADAHSRAIQRLGEHGWTHYEISNWARTPDHRSIHNQVYWQNGRYYGIGAGAHGFLGERRMSNVRLPKSYIEAIQEQRLPVASEEFIDPELSMGETMMLGLRLLIDGVSGADFESRHGKPLTTQYGEVIDRFVTLGLLEWRDDRLGLTEAGIMVSNGVLAEFLPE